MRALQTGLCFPPAAASAKTQKTDKGEPLYAAQARRRPLALARCAGNSHLAHSNAFSKLQRSRWGRQTAGRRDGELRPGGFGRCGLSRVRFEQGAWNWEVRVAERLAYVLTPPCLRRSRVVTGGVHGWNLFDKFSPAPPDRGVVTRHGGHAGRMPRVLCRERPAPAVLVAGWRRRRRRDRENGTQPRVQAASRHPGNGTGRRRQFKPFAGSLLAWRCMRTRCTGARPAGAGTPCRGGAAAPTRHLRIAAPAALHASSSARSCSS